MMLEGISSHLGPSSEILESIKKRLRTHCDIFDKALRRLTRRLTPSSLLRLLLRLLLVTVVVSVTMVRVTTRRRALWVDSKEMIQHIYKVANLYCIVLLEVRNCSS